MTTPNEELRKLAELAIACTTQSRLIDFEKACDPTKAVALLDQLQSQAERIKELEEQHHSAMQAAEKEIEHYRLKSAALREAMDMMIAQYRVEKAREE
jgi:hypothetical protein